MTNKIKGYCVKCKKDVDLQNVRITWVSSRRVAKGKCPVCGAEITRFMKKTEHPA